MGVDMATYNELIAHHCSVPEIAQKLEVDSLHFLSLEGMMEAIDSTTGYCNACFTGNYPFHVDPSLIKTGFEDMAG
jgi:amidophosphoribosyltransferase